MAGVFVTGTDTDCGKTLVSTLLIRAIRARGLRVAGFKPVAAGASMRDGMLQNDDALALADASGLGLAYRQVNPYCFAAPVSPHLAAGDHGETVGLARLRDAGASLAAASDYLVVEGAGGWRVPLGPGLDVQGLALDLGLPVLLVVGMRLGCLNHALLTAQAIATSGAPLVGWVANRVDPQMARFEANLATLRERLDAPCLGVVPYLGDAAGRDPVVTLDITRLPGLA
jgi:dethiobiotin synthetase